MSLSSNIERIRRRGRYWLRRVRREVAHFANPAKTQASLAERSQGQAVTSARLCKQLREAGR